MYVLGLCSFFCLICNVLHPFPFIYFLVHLNFSVLFCLLCPYISCSCLLTPSDCVTRNVLLISLLWPTRLLVFSSDQQVLFQNLPKTYCFCTVSAYTLHRLKVLCQPLIHKHLVSLPQDYATCLEDVFIFQLGNFTCTCTVIPFFPFGWFLSLNLTVVHTR